MTITDNYIETELVWHWLSEIPDPEIPVISLTELGVIRDVCYEDDMLVITISPTYSGCPATKVIRQDIEAELRKKGAKNYRIETQLSPAWSSAWISDEGRENLRKYGIAPPNFKHPTHGSGVPEACPQCGALQVNKISEFGSTPCKALWKCEACSESFDYFKCI